MSSRQQAPAALVNGRARVRRLGPRMLWTTADQMVSSATNAAVSFLIARQVGEVQFGSFAAAFLAFTLAAGLNRALVTDALMVRFSAATPAALRRACGDAAAATLITGMAGGLVLVVLGWLLGDLTGSVLVALGIVLPGLLLQGTWRQAFFASARPAAAFAIDLLWAALQVLGVVLVQQATGSMVALVLVWGASGGLAAVVATVAERVRPAPRRGGRWLHRHRDLGSGFALEFGISQAAATVSVLLVGLVLGLAGVASIRGAQVLLGPVYVLIPAVTAFTLPLLAQRRKAQRPVLPLAAAAGGGAAVLTLLWVGVLLAVPDSVGFQLLGATWPGARSVLPLSGLQWALISLALGAVLGLKAHERAATLLRLTSVQAPLLVGLSLAGASLSGVRAAVAGLAVAQLVGAVLNWWVLLKVERGTSTLNVD